MPEVTVLMPVHNAAAYVNDALRSVLDQSFRDFELLVIDDVSSDGSADLVKRIRDPRLRLLRNGANLGVAESLNRGLECATGKYVARMDADDMSAAQRIERQLDWLKKHPQVGVVGAWARFKGRFALAVNRRPVGERVVRAFLCLANPIIHPTTMIRRDILVRQGLRYDGAFNRSEDFDLWSRLSEHASLDNLPEVLLDYRVHAASITSQTRAVMDDQSRLILARELGRFGVRPTASALAFHAHVGLGRRLQSPAQLDRAEAWLVSLLARNAEAGYHSEPAMKSAVGFAWFRLCANSANLGPRGWAKYRASSLSRSAYAPSMDERLRWMAGVMWNACRRNRGLNDGAQNDAASAAPTDKTEMTS